MPRAKTLPGPSRLSQILKNLNAHPKPQLPTLKALKLTFAARNDDFGARHFVKNDLPRIQYANPELDIKINKIPRSIGDEWRAEMQLQFKNGSQASVDITEKWSTTIFEELMNRAGGDRWQAYKAERRASGKEPVAPTVKPRSAGATPPSPDPRREGVSAALP